MFRVVTTPQTARHSKASGLQTPGSQRQRNKRTVVAGLMSYLREKLILWRAAEAIARERKILVKSSEEQLRDMGITRAQAEDEFNRKYFDVPGCRLTMVGILDSAKQTQEQTRGHDT